VIAGHPSLVLEWGAVGYRAARAPSQAALSVKWVSKRSCWPSRMSLGSPALAPPGHAAAGHVGAIPITPPPHRDLSVVVAAGQPPTGAAQALLDLLAAGFPGDTG
jgi:hypothetical protein